MDAECVKEACLSQHLQAMQSLLTPRNVNKPLDEGGYNATDYLLCVANERHIDTNPCVTWIMSIGGYTNVNSFRYRSVMELRTQYIRRMESVMNTCLATLSIKSHPNGLGHDIMTSVVRMMWALRYE